MSGLERGGAHGRALVAGRSWALRVRHEWRSPRRCAASWAGGANGPSS